MLTLKAARAITGGGLGFPGKMPGTSYGLPAQACLVGSKLAAIPGSVCHGCYALKGNYRFGNVQRSQANRLASLADPAWTMAMVTLLQHEYEDACREYTDLIRKHARRARRIRRDHLKATSHQTRKRVVGSGKGRSIATDTAITRRPEALNPAMYPLTLPRSGAIVALSPLVSSCTTSAAIDFALIQTICNYLATKSTSKCTPANAATLLPEGLELDYFFRFHDSGDLQSLGHLAKIAAVASATPRIKHWLPTRETKIVLDYVNAGGVVPPNLLIRVSATMIDGQATKAWPTTSGVHSGHKPSSGRACPAPRQGNKCGDCRACWSTAVDHVSYHVH